MPTITNPYNMLDMIEAYPAYSQGRRDERAICLGKLRRDAGVLAGESDIVSVGKRRMLLELIEEIDSGQ